MNDLHEPVVDARHFHAALADMRGRFARMQPEMTLTVHDPALALEGWVVVWNTAIAAGGPLHGCGKGGTRCDLALDLPQVARLAQTMALKNAAAGLPLGGAKSGVRMAKDDPRYERKWRRFVALTSPVLRERGGCFGGYGYDMGCRIPDNALWAVDELTSKGLGSGRSVTGKPVELGGTDYDVEGIAGLGVSVAAQALLQHRHAATAGARFAVQGMGAMGAAICRYFLQAGAQLAALSDPLYAGTWAFERPLSGELAAALAARQTELVRALLPHEGRHVSADSAQVLQAEVDVLFPAACEDVITAGNAASIRARAIVEAANNPTTDDAHAILFARDVRVIPDVIANAGGIIAAFVEMTAPNTGQSVAAREKVALARQMTRERIAANAARLLQMVERLRVRADEAADYLALRALLEGDPTPPPGLRPDPAAGMPSPYIPPSTLHRP